MRTMCAALAALALVVMVVPVSAGDKYAAGGECVCPGMNAATAMWCPHCNMGMAFGQKIKSQKLTEALAGHQTEASKIKCSGCRTALEKNGSCAHCKVSFVKGMAFHSPVSVALAKGKVVRADAVQCPACRTNIEKGKGQCSHCDASVLNGVVYMGKDDYKAARKANGVLAKAVKAAEKCEGCAVAMVTDGTCAGCNVSFADGKKVKEGRKY